MKQIIYLSVLSQLLWGCVNKGVTERPNILWIVTEDIGLDMACYGTKGVYTPNLDQMAAEGALFSNAFTTASVCSPSRSSFMTGLYPTQVHSHNMRIRPPFVKQDLPEGVHIFTKYMEEAGYATGLCGHPKTDWGFELPEEAVYGSRDWEELTKKEPFFCQYQFYATHRPFMPCKEHPVKAEDIELHPYTADIPEAREELRQYLEHLNLLDMQVGELLEDLKNKGLYEHTIIVFSGDNGPPVIRGKGFLYDRGIAMPLIVRVPKKFIPKFKPGTVIEELVSAMDFAPTFIDYAGGVIPDYMQGRIFLGKNKEAEPDYLFALRDRHGVMIDRSRSVRSRQFKYIRNYMPEKAYWDMSLNNIEAAKAMEKLFEKGELPPHQAAFFKEKPGEELYDILNDPFEINNLAESPAHSGTLDEMRSALDQWIIDTRDEGRLQEDPEDVEEMDRLWSIFVKERNERNRKAREKTTN